MAGRSRKSRLRDRRGRDRLRAEGAGPDRELPFTDRVIATLVILRFQLPHAALAVLYGVHRSTITRAVGEIRPLLAARGFAVPGEPGLRLRTLADVFAYAAAAGRARCGIDGTEVQVRRPRAGRPGRRAFVSGKKKQNTIKPTAIGDGQGRLLWLGRSGPAGCTTSPRCAPTASKTCSAAIPMSRPRSMPGTRAWPVTSPARSAPRRRNRRTTPPPEETASWKRNATSSPPERICVEHAIAEPKQWRALQRYLGRREYFEETALAIAGLVSDRAAER